jgi:hypothetical protein
MRIDTKDPRELWKLYAEGQTYKSAINLYHTVEVNEDFYAGDQWRGLNAPNIDKPIINIIRQPVNYMVSTVVADDVVIDLTPCLPSAEDESYLDSVKDEVNRIREQIDMETVSREAVRKAAVDADVALYHYWDSSVKTGQRDDGDIRAHLIESTNVIFGNPACRDVQRQPYIQIVMRDYIEDVIDEAIANGMSETDARELIKPDDDSRTDTEMHFDKLVTKLLTFYKRGGTIYGVISTSKTIIKKEWNTKLTLYPIAWFSWQPSRSSYHGVSFVTEMVPTQIFVNKLVANYMRVVSMYAWPKIIYKRAIFPHGFDNRIGANIAVDGNPNDAYAAIFPGTGATADVVNCLDWVMGRIKESSGANDASLGQINSDNTSAIIAAQEANTVPLDLVKRAFYGFQEQIVRIIIDMLRAYGGTRYVKLTEDEQKAQAQMEQIPMSGSYDNMGMGYETEGMDDIGSAMGMARQLPTELSSPVVSSADSIGTTMDIANAPDGTKVIDFSRLGEMAWNLKVSAGAGSFFSEALRNTTISNLVQMGLMSAKDYYKRVSDKFVPMKQELIDELEAQEAYQGQMPMDKYGAGAVPYMPRQGEPTIEDSSSVANAKNYIEGMRPMA